MVQRSVMIPPKIGKGRYVLGEYERKIRIGRIRKEDTYWYVANAPKIGKGRYVLGEYENMTAYA